MGEKAVAKAFDDLDRALYNYINRLPYGPGLRIRAAMYNTARAIVQQARQLITNVESMESEDL